MLKIDSGSVRRTINRGVTYGPFEGLKWAVRDPALRRCHRLWDGLAELCALVLVLLDGGAREGGPVLDVARLHYWRAGFSAGEVVAPDR